MREEITELYVTGRLTENDREAFEAHFFECGRCFEELNAYQLVQEELDRACASDWRHTSPDAPRRTGSWTWLAAAAVVALGLSIWKRSSTSVKRGVARVIGRRRTGRQSGNSGGEGWRLGDRGTAV
jgi:anti-sigma factor RsiW